MISSPAVRASLPTALTCAAPAGAGRRRCTLGISAAGPLEASARLRRALPTAIPGAAREQPSQPAPGAPPWTAAPPAPAARRAACARARRCRPRAAARRWAPCCGLERCQARRPRQGKAGQEACEGAGAGRQGGLRLQAGEQRLELPRLPPAPSHKTMLPPALTATHLSPGWCTPGRRAGSRAPWPAARAGGQQGRHVSAGVLGAPPAGPAARLLLCRPSAQRGAPAGSPRRRGRTSPGWG